MFRKILTVLTLLLVAFVVWEARSNIAQAVNYLTDANLLCVLLLIPEQLFMYYCAGQMFFSYMAAKDRLKAEESEDEKKIAKKSTDSDKATKVSENSEQSLTQAENKTTKPKRFSPWLLTRISFELNFVNHAIPSGGVAGLGYITWRLKQLGSSASQTSFMYVLRYTITILCNQAQTLIALLLLVIFSGVPDGAWWAAGLVGLVSTGVILGVIVVICVASSKKRIRFAAKIFTKVVNGLVKAVTFGHKPQILPTDAAENFLMDFYKDIDTARHNRKILKGPIIWGIIYNALEYLIYWVMAVAMGHPEILPQIIIGQAMASVIGAVLLTPGGVGGYEGAMIGLMMIFGVNGELATAVVITTRVVVLVGTIVSGYGFYQQAISKIGKKERAEILGEKGGD